ncbi:MAG: hypothetical protein R2731_18585 [Nocardioides sp.]
MTPRPAMPLRPRSWLVLTLASIAGVVMLAWPLFVQVSGTQRVDPPFVFLALLPVVLVVVLAELGEGGMDARVLALLGVLSAINAVLRGLGAGLAGIELVFFLLVLAGRVFDPGSASRWARCPCSPRRCSRRASGRGCPSRCSSPPGWAWVRGYCRVASGAVPSSRCWRRTAWSRPTPTAC